jgi:hypothetical protein
VRAEPAVLHRCIPRCALVRTDDTASASWTVVESATPGEIALLLASLDTEGASPIAARFDEACIACEESGS